MHLLSARCSWVHSFLSDGALQAVGNAGTGKLVVQVFPRTKVVRISDVENVKKVTSMA